MADLAVWPTDGADGSVSSEARWRKMGRLWVPSGIDPIVPPVVGAAKPPGLAPTLVAGPTINVAAGNCWLDGHFAELAAPASIPATANGLLVVRFTPADNHAELLYRDAATAPTRTAATWELEIALMVAGAMTDVRLPASNSGHLLYVSGAGGAITSVAGTALLTMPPFYSPVGELLLFEMTSWNHIVNGTGAGQVRHQLYVDGVIAGSLAQVSITPAPGFPLYGRSFYPVSVAGFHTYRWAANWTAPATSATIDTPLFTVRRVAP